MHRFLMLRASFRTMMVMAATAAILLVTAEPSHAVSFGFGNITANNVNSATTGETQLFVDVTNDGLPVDQVLFTFFNTGPLASSITDVYFDDGTLLGIASVINSSGVSFSQGASPGNLPGGNPSFETTAGFSADSDPPTQPNGVNPGETLGILFNLQAGKTYDNTITALLGGTDLKIGIHVQGFEGGYSESFANNLTPVPEPGTLLLLGSGLAGLGLLGKRKRVPGFKSYDS